MDNTKLMSLMLQRAAEKEKAPSQLDKRTATADAMSLAYANNWNPSPMMIRLMNK